VQFLLASFYFPEPPCTNFTYYYQSTNYEFYELLWINKLLCGQDKTTVYTPDKNFLVLYIPLKYFTTFCITTIIILWNYYFRNRKGLLDHIQTKKYFGIVTARVFSQRFYSLMKPFFLKSLEQRDTDSLFATIPLWYSLFGVDCTKGVECLCTQFVNCNTGVILSQSTSTW